MEIVCTHCKSSFILPDERIPDAKKFKLNCPKCREPIIIDMSELDVVPTAPETFPHDAVVAFVFCTQVIFSQRIKSSLKKNGIYVSEALSISEAIEKVRVNYYDIIIIEESNVSNALYEIFKKWNGLRRREVNIVVVGANCQSLQGQDAFLRGVNSVIGKSDNDEIDKYLELALAEYKKYIEPWEIVAKRMHMAG